MTLLARPVVSPDLARDSIILILREVRGHLVEDQCDRSRFSARLIQEFFSGFMCLDQLLDPVPQRLIAEAGPLHACPTSFARKFDGAAKHVLFVGHGDFTYEVSISSQERLMKLNR